MVLGAIMCYGVGEVFFMNKISKYILMFAFVMGSGIYVGAEPDFLPNDPKRPVAKISEDLRVSPEQFVACFRNVRPASAGTRPTAERVRSNKVILLSCLQKANPSITNDILDGVMDKYRPGGHEAQEPEK